MLKVNPVDKFPCEAVSKSEIKMGMKILSGRPSLLHQVHSFEAFLGFRVTSADTPLMQLKCRKGIEKLTNYTKNSIHLTVRIKKQGGDNLNL